MKHTPINPRALATYNGLALAVSLQGAIDDGLFKKKAKMYAKQLEKELAKQLATMYKATDPEIIVFHQISRMFDEVINYLCQCNTMEEYEAKWAKVQQALGNEVQVIHHEKK